MKDTTSMRTRLDPKTLRSAADILRSLAEACEACAADGATWSKACRDRGLVPRKARDAVLNVPKCAPGADVPLEELGFLAPLDGYELFYQKVFGDWTLVDTALPAGYQEAAMHVLTEMGMDSREADVLMRRFGIGPYELPQTYEAAGRDIGVTRDRVRQIEMKALRRCRVKERRETLLYGIEGYEEEKKRRLAENQKVLYDRTKAADMESAMRKIKATDIGELELDTRSYNALRCAGKKDVLSLLAISTHADLMKLRNLGDIGIAKTLRKLETYVQKNYGMSVIELRRLLPSGWTALAEEKTEGDKDG